MLTMLLERRMSPEITSPVYLPPPPPPPPPEGPAQSSHKFWLTGLRKFDVIGGGGGVQPNVSLLYIVPKIQQMSLLFRDVDHSA